ncbi:hypothetical protein C8Q75DRAFT_831716 [Abortiporus biennis]|nr:hypothetical protein C8Q75DRAFT_831716 [Abortiporus biennis]
MSFTYAPDFIVKRKRKRHRPAIDPCLGFYPSSPQPTFQPSPDPSVDANETLEEPAEISGNQAENREVHNISATELPNEPPESSKQPVRTYKTRKTRRNGDPNEQITVEDFLRWSAQLGKTSSRTTKKRRYVDLRNPPAARTPVPPQPNLSDEDEDYCIPRRPKRRCVFPTIPRTPSPSNVDTGSPRRSKRLSNAEISTTKRRNRKNATTKKKNKKKVAKFADHLYPAAIASNVDLDEQYATHLTDKRRPLVVQPCEEMLLSPSPPNEPKNYKMIMPWRTNSKKRNSDLDLDFIAAKPSCERTKFKTMSQWMKGRTPASLIRGHVINIKPVQNVPNIQQKQDPNRKGVMPIPMHDQSCDSLRCVV